MWSGLAILNWVPLGRPVGEPEEDASLSHLCFLQPWGVRPLSPTAMFLLKDESP